MILSRKNPQYRQRLFERLGLVNRHFKKGGIIVHAASVGEVIALKRFIEQTIIAYPHQPITVTTFTPTGSAQLQRFFAHEIKKNTLQHCYLPLDCWPCTTFFLKALKPKAIVFMETELWPNLVAQAGNQHIRLLLINARLSQKSVKSYQKIGSLIKPTLNYFDKILCQSQDNVDRFISLGANTSCCENAGNVKFDIEINDSVLEKKQELAEFLPENRIIWLIASTHHGDEAIALTTFKTLQKTHPDLLLIIVPRHPDRFDEIAKLCLSKHFNIARRSQRQNVTKQTNIWLLDSLGELMAAYALADIVTIGGSFSAVGGHNPLEPALFKKPIIAGPRMDNFIEIEQQLTAVSGLVKLTSTKASELTKALLALLTNPTQQALLGNNAYQVVQQNQGASERCLHALQQFIPVNIFTDHQTYSDAKTKTFGKYNKKWVKKFISDMLNSEYWHAKQAITGSAQGRGTTWFIASQNQHWVLRHYYRGGLIGKLIKDSYWFTQGEQTRAAKEYDLLNKMSQWQLPAPKGIAYRIQKRGLIYQADLLSSRIENAQDLVAILTEKSISDECWQHIGQTIKQFHKHGVYHHDLNAHNILLDVANKAWLIDFDRGELRKVSSQWQHANLQRLLRSFNKENNKLAVFHWCEENWQMLMRGYESSA